MAARPPHFARTAFVLTLLVAVLALAPLVDALSARASVRANVKVDPSADPSSFLPTWPTGSDNPCIYVLGTIGDVGNHLGLDCKSYICVNRVLFGGQGACIVRVNPGTPTLQYRILWMPASLDEWRISAWAVEFANQQNAILECPGLTGPGGPVPPAPMSLPACDLTPYWVGAAQAGVRFNLDFGQNAAGTIGVYIGPPDPLG